MAARSSSPRRAGDGRAPYGPMPAIGRRRAREGARERWTKRALALCRIDIATIRIGSKRSRSVQKLTQHLQLARLQRRDGDGRVEHWRSWRARRQRRAAARSSSSSDAACAPKAPRRTSTAQGPVGMAAGIAMAEYSDAAPTRRQRHVRHARAKLRDDIAQREDGDARGARVRSTPTSSCAATRVSANHLPRRRLRTCCRRSRRGERLTSGWRADAPDDVAERATFRSGGGRHSFVREHQRRPRQHPSRSADPGHPRGRTAPNVVPITDRTVADFYIRYPDEVPAAGRWSSCR